VRLTSRRGSVEVKALVTDRVKGNTLYLPIHHAKPDMNILTGDHRDADVKTPAYKETAVKLERLSKKDRPPMHDNNYRYGHPTPTAGPEVERKWARDDYVPPPAEAPKPERI
jgi:formate dehydrogenase major subunit